MADDKQEGTPDPWAGLEAAGEGDTNEEFAMSFDGLEPEAVAAEPAAVRGQPVTARTAPRWGSR